MGNTKSMHIKGKKSMEIVIQTGDVLGAGTDAVIHIVFVDVNGIKSLPIEVSCTFLDDFQRGKEHTLIVNDQKIGDINRIEIWRGNAWLFGDWFVDLIKVRRPNKTLQWKTFPIHRWIKANKKYRFYISDSILPQFDEYKRQRQQELQEKRETFVYGPVGSIKGALVGEIPRLAKELPESQKFSFNYLWDLGTIAVTDFVDNKVQSILNKERWTELSDLQDVYGEVYEIPTGFYDWRSDARFGAQRLIGCNPTSISLCKSIPKNFAVTSEMVEPFLAKDLTLQEAMDKNSIYIVNHDVLANLPCTKENVTVCAPLALFYQMEDKDLVPIAIQLFQEPSEDNPVFLPSDPEYTWLMAKMFFNNADAQVHQSAPHLCFTHLVSESICVAVHQCVSPSHPVFRLLAPHFLYVLPINFAALSTLLAAGGTIDEMMTSGRIGTLEIIKRKWETWRMDLDGWLPADLKNRGVDNQKALPSYYFRDDGMLVHEAIQDYVTDVLSHVYDAPEKLIEDYEIQNLASVLIDPVDGAGIKGVFGNGKFEKLEDLVKTVTSTIFLSSAQHAAVNFMQYDQYGFPPNYPAIMQTTNVVRDKKPLTIDDILEALPNKQTTLNIMATTKLLSTKDTDSLGHFKEQYQHAPYAVEAVNKFKTRLMDISTKIKARNSKLQYPYPHLDPDQIPNAISI